MTQFTQLNRNRRTGATGLPAVRALKAKALRRSRQFLRAAHPVRSGRHVRKGGHK